MYKRAIAWLCATAVFIPAATAYAAFHLWTLSEVYSNADATVQFIELRTSAGGQQFIAGHTLTSSQGAASHLFVFPTDLPGDTAGRTFLIGTTGFAALGLVTPDYIVPDGFLFTTNGSVNFAGVDGMSWNALPIDGVMSIDRSGATEINSPTNFDGATATVTPPATPECTLTATPVSITPGGSSTLSASCSPAATSYVWTGGTCAGTSAASCTVRPTVTTTYTVAGVNSAGTGAIASATVTVIPPPTPVCTLTANPASIVSGGSSTLTASCSPTATSYVWTGGTCAGTTAAVCTVSPTATTTYTVSGVNGEGTGAAVSATVTVTLPPVNSQSDCLFNWAEGTYPALFAPARAASITLAPWYYRYYSQTDSYLGTSSVDNHVYYKGPATDYSVVDAGAMSAWLPTAGCQ